MENVFVNINYPVCSGKQYSMKEQMRAYYEYIVIKVYYRIHRAIKDVLDVTNLKPILYLRLTLDRINIRY